MREHLIKKSIVLGSTLLLLLGVSAAGVFAGGTYAKQVKKGVEELKRGEYQDARDSFEEAVRINDAAPDGHFGLGMAYFHLREDSDAEKAFTRVIEIRPRDAEPYKMLGELYYRMDDFEQARRSWEKAVALEPANAGLRARLERIKREHKTERDFNRDVTSNFLVKYEGREKISAGRIVLAILEDAYGDVGKELSYYPSHEIQVILYSNKQFQDVTRAPDWSAGIYDGKIRMPIGGIEKETPALRRILYHEYTHAVVRAITPRVPSWLNEGLAMHFEGRVLSAGNEKEFRQIARAGKLPALSKLEGSFVGLRGDQVRYAYLFSLSAVRFMIDRYGLYRATTILEELAKGASVGDAVSTGLLISYEEFNRQWKESLQE